MTRRSLTSLLFLLVVLAACGPRVRPDRAEEKEPPPRTTRPATEPAPGREVLIGEMCPDGAGGRPAVAPLLVRAVGWSDDAGDVGAQLERNARAFAVLGVDGRRAGVFEVLGAADVGLPAEVAIGSYAGRAPCAPYSDEGGAAEDPACKKATRGCGLAVASIDRVSAETGEAPEIATGGGCVSGDSLVVDVDGDGAAESFPLAGFVDPVRAPAEEVLAAPVVSPSCTPRFAIYEQVVKPPPEKGVADDPRYHVTLDVIGVADLDGDGRHEIVVTFRYPEGRTVAVYSALRQSGRLDLVGEAVPWQ
jgi:hypothetical protein